MSRQTRPAVLSALIVLDAFALGALVGVYAVQQVLVDTMNRLVSASAQAEILNALDHLLPYFIGSIAVVLMLGLATVLVYLGWIMTRRVGAASQ